MDKGGNKPFKGLRGINHELILCRAAPPLIFGRLQSQNNTNWARIVYNWRTTRLNGWGVPYIVFGESGSRYWLGWVVIAGNDLIRCLKPPWITGRLDGTLTLWRSQRNWDKGLGEDSIREQFLGCCTAAPVSQFWEAHTRCRAECHSESHWVLVE